MSQTSPSVSVSDEITAGISTTPMLENNPPAFRVLQIRWDSGFRGTDLKPSDLIIAVNGKNFSRPNDTRELQVVVSSSVGQLGESYFWKSAGAKDGDPVILDVRRRKINGIGWETLEIKGLLYATRFYLDSEQKAILGPGGPRRDGYDGFSEPWYYWYDNFAKSIERILDYGPQRGYINSRYELQGHMAQKARVDFLVSHYPGPFAESVRADWEAARLLLEGDLYKPAQGEFDYRKAGEERVKAVADMAAKAWEQFLMEHAAETIQPFPAVDPIHGDRSKVVGKYVVLPPIRNRDWISEAGHNYLVVTGEGRTVYVADTESPSAQQMFFAARRYTRLVAPNLREEYRVIGRILPDPKIIDSDVLSDLAVKAVLAVVSDMTGHREVHDENNYFMPVDLDNVKVQKKPGGAMRDSSFIEGIIVDKEIAHPEMPLVIKDAKILLVNSPLEIEKTEFEAKIMIDRPEQMKMFLEEETTMIRTMVEKIAKTGANIVICQKGIDDVALGYMARANISALKRVKESDIAALEKATGARAVTNLDDLSPKDLGFAQLVEERQIETDKWVFVEKCKNPKAVSILIRGGSERVVDEAERSMHDALMVVKDVVQKPTVVAGGGSPEAYIARKLRAWATGVSGREHYAILAFADALESIPIALAENAGMDVIDTLAAIHSKQLSENNPWIGVDVKELKLADMSKINIIEPLKVKEQVLKSATETAAMLLRIDDILSASRTGAGQ